jgi:hypothetical protein
MGALGAGTSEGFTIGAGVMAGGRDGEGRARMTGETATAGVADAAGTVAETSGAVVAADAAIDGLGLGLIVGEGRTRTVADAAGVAVTAVAGVVAGLGLAALVAGVAVGVNLGRVLGEGVELDAAAAVGLGVTPVVCGVGVVALTGVGLAVAGADGAGVVAAVAAGVAEAVATEVSCGFTNFFGGAFGGGVDSVRIFVRARSAADRSAIDVQPFSILTSTMRSFTRRGLVKSRTTERRGTETSSSFPRTRADVSMFRSRRSR